ncbi:MAG: hypothetical protein N3A01_08340 [Bacteroidales bacterium]|nr:hypothetical protein [Bacteroidales bacterium]
MKKNKWVLFYKTYDEIKLNKIKCELEEIGIAYSVVNKKDTLLNIGEYQIFIPVEHLIKAKYIIKGIDTDAIFN